MLVAYLARMGTLAGDDVRAIALRLLERAAVLEVATTPGTALASAALPGAHPKLHVIRPGETAGAVPPAEQPRTPEPAAQKAESTMTDLMGDMMLGQILLQRGHILEEHIHQAMKVQRTAPLRIGDILVKIGACSRVQIEEALRHQSSFRRIRGSLAESDPPASTQRVLKLDSPEMRGTGLKLVGEIMLGEILIERNVITRRQLERALEVQKATGARIGEALVKMGATTHEHIEHALRLQGANRKFTGKPGKS